jgi:hypothetical protein
MSGITHRIDFFQCQNVVGTIGGAISAINTNLGFVGAGIPKHGSKWAGIYAVFAADTKIGFQSHSTLISAGQGIRRADPGTGCLIAGSADDDDKSFANPTCGLDMDTGFV